eukprot:gene8308-9195_t
MPGGNCRKVNCTTYASNAEYPQLSLFKVPSSSAKTQQKKEWRSKLLHLINRANKTKQRQKDIENWEPSNIVSSPEKYRDPKGKTKARFKQIRIISMFFASTS